MRHIYNGGSSDTSGSFDKDEAWSEVMEAGTEAGGVAEGVAERGGGQRWVMTDPVTMMPDTMCVDLSLTSLLACIHASIFVLVLNITRMYFSTPLALAYFYHLKHFLVLDPFAPLCFCHLSIAGRFCSR